MSISEMLRQLSLDADLAFARSVQEIVDLLRDRLGFGLWNYRGFDGVDGNSDSTWVGIVIHDTEPPGLFGTLIAACNGKPFIVRGYPTATHVTDMPTDGYDIIQPKYDGIQVSLFAHPYDGHLWGKTIHLEFLERHAYHTTNWMELINRTGLADSIQRLVSEHKVSLVGELYGREIGSVLPYEHDVAFVAFDIIDLKTHQFLPPDQVQALCTEYGIPVAPLLTAEEATSIGHEGLVFKRYLDGDLWIEAYLWPEILQARQEINGAMTVAIRRTKEWACNHSGPTLYERLQRNALEAGVPETYIASDEFRQLALLHFSPRSDERLRELVLPFLHSLPPDTPDAVLPALLESHFGHGIVDFNRIAPIIAEWRASQTTGET